jgi:hypothetical protein
MPELDLKEAVYFPSLQTTTTLYPTSMSLEPITSSTHDLSTSSESSVLRSLLEEAVKEYEKQVGTSLIENQLAIRLRSCDTIESINEVLEERV